MDSSSQQRRGGGIVSQSPSPSPSQTPRSTDKAARDLRSGDSHSNSSTKQDKEKGVNVQVIVRCRSVFLFSLSLFFLKNRKVGVLTCLLFFFRPLSEDEQRVHTPVVISCNEGRREVSAVQNIANKQIDRNFLFDKVLFGTLSVLRFCIVEKWIHDL
jgi:kinesin family protein 11